MEGITNKRYNKEMNLLSIIIPTYNMEAYLGRCLGSLLIGEQQSLLDVIVVNDGSKDHSSEIAHQYADKYSNSIRVIDKPNGNYGSCVNAALKVAKGKYVRMLDADDYYDTDVFIRFLDRIKGIDADVIFSPFMREFSDSSEKVLCGKDYKDGELIDCNMVSLTQKEMHSVTYKKSLFDEVYYHQTEGISYTDTEFVFYPFFKASKAIYIDEPVYRYQIGREGQTVDPAIFIKNIGALEKIMLRMLNHISKEKVALSAPKLATLNTFMLERIQVIYRIELVLAENGNPDNLEEFESLIKEYDEAYHNSLIYPLSANLHILLFRKKLLSNKKIKSLCGFLANVKRKLRQSN